MPTRPVRPQVIATPLVARIPTSPAIFQPITTDFAGYTKQTLGDLGESSDGWDAAFAPIAQAIDADVKGLSTFDELLNSVSFNTGDFSKTYLDPVDAVLPGLLSDGDALNAIVQNPGSITGTPTITTIPDPPVIDTGGDGGDGGSPGDNPPPPYVPGAYIGWGWGWWW